MFIEPKLDKGRLEVICGSMFSGKTEELLRRLKRAVIAGQKISLFKPAIDRRFHDQMVVSHDNNRYEAMAVNDSSEILGLVRHEQVVGIDEAQFFEPGLTKTVEQLLKLNKRVVIAGLDLDSNGEPFGSMPALMASAEYVTKVHAICVKCGDIATFTFKKIRNNQQVELGAKELYEARCRACFQEGMLQQKDQIGLGL